MAQDCPVAFYYETSIVLYNHLGPGICCERYIVASLFYLAFLVPIIGASMNEPHCARDGREDNVDVKEVI